MRDALRPTAAFPTMSALLGALDGMPGPDADAIAAAEARNATLTKPAGALGRLETLAIWYVGWRGETRPRAARAQAIVFAADHGVARRGVSPYPVEVTRQMLGNFEAGGAAINQLADLAGVALSVADVGVGAPTADFTEAPAMDEPRFLDAVSAGWRAVDASADALILGEMGIGNTTAAAATAAALYGGEAGLWVGAGAGHDAEGQARKTDIVAAALALHRPALDALDPRLRPLEALRRLGGLEMAAIFGATLAARWSRIPVIMDGFISAAAMAPLALAAAGGLDHVVAGHLSAERAHGALLRHLEKEPILSLGMRLGEGSGAALAYGVLQGALACYAGMATFAEAAVSTRGA